MYALFMQLLLFDSMIRRMEKKIECYKRTIKIQGIKDWDISRGSSDIPTREIVGGKIMACCKDRQID